ncbi:MAG: hypothetical protein LBQ88_08830 [Treponema sp.]|jgi:hypothetical protein|nr:hypothetical protein [Treponema sp.]
MNEKVYSLDGENYNITNKKELIDGLMDWKTKSKDELIGKEYFEGEAVKSSVKDFVDADFILSAINESAWERHGEFAEDWPCLNDVEKEQLEEMVTKFLEEKAPITFYGIKNSVAKTITAEDL